MSTILKSSGITFDDDTTLTSIYNFVPQNRKTLFYQASAPTGWTKVTTAAYNNSLIRVFSGTGQTLTSGSIIFTDVFKSHPISKTLSYSGSFLAGEHTLTTAQIASHNHPANGSGGVTETINWLSGSLTRINPGNHSTGNAGGSGSHTHPMSYGTATGPFSTTLSLNVKYIDCIVCSLD